MTFEIIYWDSLLTFEIHDCLHLSCSLLKYLQVPNRPHSTVSCLSTGKLSQSAFELRKTVFWLDPKIKHPSTEYLILAKYFNFQNRIQLLIQITTPLNVSFSLLGDIYHPFPPCMLTVILSSLCLRTNFMLLQVTSEWWIHLHDLTECSYMQWTKYTLIDVYVRVCGLHYLYLTRRKG